MAFSDEQLKILQNANAQIRAFREQTQEGLATLEEEQPPPRQAATAPGVVPVRQMVNIQMPDGSVMENIPVGTPKNEIIAKWEAKKTAEEEEAKTASLWDTTSDFLGRRADAVIGAGELAATLGTGAISSLAGGLAALGAGAVGAVADIATDEDVEIGSWMHDTFKWMSDKGTYKPFMSQAGHGAVEGAGAVFQKLDDTLFKAGTYAGDAYGPEAGVAAYTLANGLLMVSPIKAAKVVRNRTRRVKPDPTTPDKVVPENPVQVVDAEQPSQFTSKSDTVKFEGYGKVTPITYAEYKGMLEATMGKDKMPEEAAAQTMYDAYITEVDALNASALASFMGKRPAGGVVSAANSVPFERVPTLPGARPHPPLLEEMPVVTYEPPILSIEQFAAVTLKPDGTPYALSTIKKKYKKYTESRRATEPSVSQFRLSIDQPSPVLAKNIVGTEEWTIAKETEWAHSQREASLLERKVAEENLAWEQQGILDAEARVDAMMGRLNISPEGVVSAPTRASFGNARVGDIPGFRGQRGAIDPQAFAEMVAALKGKTKNLQQFTDDLVAAFGESVRPLAASFYQQEPGSAGPWKETPPGSPGPSFVNRPTPAEMAGGRGGFVRLASELKVGTIQDMASKANQTLLGGYAHRLRTLTQYSPTLAQLLDLIDKPAYADHMRRKQLDKKYPGTAPIKHMDFETELHVVGGEYQKRLDTTLDKLKIKLGAGIRDTFKGASISKKYNKALSLALSKGEIKGTGPVAQVAKELRTLLDDLYKYGDDHGVPLKEYVQGYFPWMFNTDKIRKNIAEFRKDILENTRMTPQVADRILDQILDNNGDFILPNNLQRNMAEIYTALEKGQLPLNPTNVPPNRKALLGQTHRAREAGNLEHVRSLKDLPAEIALKWVNDDVPYVLSSYIQNVTSRVAYARRFGPNDEVLHKFVAQAYKESKESGRPLTKWDLNSIYDLVDMHQRTYGKMRGQYSKKLRGAQNIVTSALNMALLPLVTFTSLPEATMPLRIVTTRAYAASLPKTVINQTRNMARMIYRGVPKSEIQDLLDSIRRGTGQAATERATSIVSGDATALNNLTFRLNALHPFTIISNNIAVESLLTDMRTLGKWQSTIDKGGRLNPLTQLEYNRRREFMEWAGLDVADVRRWYEQGGKVDSAIVKERMRPAISVLMNRMVLMGSPSKLPAIMNSEKYTLLTHLSRFPTLMGTIVMREWYSTLKHELKNSINPFTPEVSRVQSSYNFAHTVAKGVTMGMAATAMALLAWELKDLLRFGSEGHPQFGKQDWNDPRKLARAFEATGFFAGYNRFYNGLVAEAQWGGDALMSMIGPAAGTASRFYSATGQLAIADSERGRSARPLIKETVGMATVLPAQTRKDITDSTNKWVQDTFGVGNKKKKKNKTTYEKSRY